MNFLMLSSRAKQAELQQVAVAQVGSGDISAIACPAQVVNVAITGSGDVKVDAMETLQMSVQGSGDVHYRGQPRIAKSVVGSGTARSID